MKDNNEIKALVWVGGSKKDFLKFPVEVLQVFGFALHLAQSGETSPIAKPFKGVGGGVIELVERYDTDTYRAIYTIRFEDAVYVLHAFQKKAKKGTRTPMKDVDLIRQRLRRAEEIHASASRKERKNDQD